MVMGWWCLKLTPDRDLSKCARCCNQVAYCRPLNSRLQLERMPAEAQRRSSGGRMRSRTASGITGRPRRSTSAKAEAEANAEAEAKADERANATNEKFLYRGGKKYKKCTRAN